MDTGDGVEEVDGGIAVEGEDSVPVEDVVGGAILGEVCVFDGA